MKRRPLLLLTLAACHQKPPPEGMAAVPAGTFVMGTDQGASYEGPARSLATPAFFIDRTEVTNDAFAAFVAKTGHVTQAEKHQSSAVFVPSAHAWTVVAGATWRHPEGPASSIDGRERHPVIHVAWSDAVAYCSHLGKRLPTEIEWERAARGPGGSTTRFWWGDAPTVDGRYVANTWQGHFPDHDDGSDGFVGTAPVRSFLANGFGVYDMAGNVWEWTADAFDASERVIRGGSWLCGEGHCLGYRVAARGHAEPDEPTNHVGFRCVR